MRLPPPRKGVDVEIRGRRIPFSAWPTYQATRREGLQWTLFATDPWFQIDGFLNELEDEDARAEAKAFLNQARDFYHSAESSDIGAAKPLLLYYSFLNLGKCLATYQNDKSIGYSIKHGISEKLPTTPGAIHGEANILRSQDANSAFKKLSDALDDTLPTAAQGSTHVPVRSQDFLSQILIGHRVWCHADGIKERFVSLQDIRFRYDPDEQLTWLTVRMHKDDLTRFSYSQKKACASLNLKGGAPFKSVACEEYDADDRQLIEFELVDPIAYPNRPSEALDELASSIKASLWRSVTSFPPYRKYYIYIPTQSQVVLSQLQSMYLATYYFGSITRYKPASFRKILESDIGPFVQEFFTNQPSQFLYLMTSYFAEQEVTKAAIV